MSETTETTPDATVAKPTIQQHLAELNQWLASRGVVIGVVAQGVRTGQLSPIEDFMPATGSHVATWALQFAQEKK